MFLSFLCKPFTEEAEPLWRPRLMHITSLHHGRYMVQLVLHRAKINYSLVIVHFVLNLNPGAAKLPSVFNFVRFLISFRHPLLSFSPPTRLPCTQNNKVYLRVSFHFSFLSQKQRDCVFYVNRPPVFSCFFFFLFSLPLSNKQI